MSTNNNSERMFGLPGYKSLVFTFIIVSSLFLLWGVCNGMIDVMDKHFQDELGLTKSQSAWVQFAHYLGYFLMALPAGWLASKLGYKGGIIAGLLMVALGGLWFLPATKINEMAQAHTISPTTAFLGYLLGVSAIAAGLTFLETVANPYTTVLGAPRYAAARINLAQSCNGIGWTLGPVLGGLFFYAKDASGHSIGSEQLYIPYLIVACVVLVLAVIFYFAYIPDIKTKDDYHIDDADEAAGGTAKIERELHRGVVYLLLLANVAVLVCIGSIFLWLIVSVFDIGEKLVGAASLIPLPFGVKATPDNALLIVTSEVACLALIVAAIGLIRTARALSHHNIWSHPHFSGAAISQFLYVAAQAGIFSFFINYMTAEVPPLPKSLHTTETNTWIDENVQGGLFDPIRRSFMKKSKDWFETNTSFASGDVKNLPALVERLRKKADPVSVCVSKNVSESTNKALNAYEGGESRSLRSTLVQELNLIVRQDPRKLKEGQLLCSPECTGAVSLGAKSKEFLALKAKEDAEIEARKAAEAKMTEEEKVAEIKRLAAQADAVERVKMPLLNRLILQDAFPKELGYHEDILCVSEQGASFLLSIGFICFLIGRFSGAAMLRKSSAHRILGIYGLMNVVMCLLIFAKLGWFSVLCVFLSFFFMSIMFPTIFALGIFGLGARAKKASAFLVMAIMGGAVLPKLMGYVADQYDMSRGFIVPLGCFAIIALYGFCWPGLSGAKSLSGVDASKGH